MGYHRGSTGWFDLYFPSACVAVSRKFEGDTVTWRYDGFRTRNGPLPKREDDSENGSATLLSWKHPVSAGTTLLVEGLSTQWRRPSLKSFSLDPHHEL